jgi:integrase
MIDTLDPKSWTTKHYVTAKNVIERYELTLTQPLTFEDINMDFYNGFVQWCKTVPYKEQEKEKVKVKTFYALNSIGSHIKEVKVLMDYANDKGWTTNMGHRHKNFKVMEEEADSIALSVDEIYMIYNTDLSDDLRSDRIRDLYCIDLWTGLRYQDIQQVGPSKFLDKGTKIKLRTHKTNKTVIIPLHGMIKLIVEKYDGKLPKVPTDQEMNRQLKEIGRKAGLLERISKTTTRAGEKMSETFFQWELLTVHTARRSFATNAIRAGIPKRDVMDLTSHQTEKSFDKYVKIGAQETADRLQDHDFFKMRPILKVEQLTFSP